ncbi:MAG: hypothetical protein R3E31_24865 [Chloroflexota bacterium]
MTAKQAVWLGKTIYADSRVAYYHLGNMAEPPNWSQPQLNQVVWKFLADHTSHRIGVYRDFEMEETLHDYMEIGGDAVVDVSMDDYLADWPGLSAGSGAESDG